MMSIYRLDRHKRKGSNFLGTAGGADKRKAQETQLMVVIFFASSAAYKRHRHPSQRGGQRELSQEEPWTQSTHRALGAEGRVASM